MAVDSVLSAQPDRRGLNLKFPLINKHPTVFELSISCFSIYSSRKYLLLSISNPLLFQVCFTLDLVKARADPANRFQLLRPTSYFINPTIQAK